MTGTPLSLPEELLLLGLDPVRGRPLTNPKYLHYGLAGAALADLEAAGRITVERGDRITVINPLPLGNAIGDGALAALPAPTKGGKGVKAHRWVHGAGRPLQELCLRVLEKRGALRRETHRALGLFPYERFPVGPVDLSGPARARFTAAVEAGLPGWRDRLLAAQVAACDLDARLLPGAAGRPHRRALRGLVKECWTSRAVHHAVQQDKSAAGG
ncbi:hypothetical protein HEK616_73450 [Streptomyces nigrescens]|uniref:GPP34 family phosphoprotein n=2 Tax=Streptomyces TaxID=1883 RepID=A0ABM8A5N4_STRNI|nr:GPP34 family phosphoprotein [Streptomyces nigrescens]MEE4423772.1 GPP34 family phosphoprotein [Streptomyces sp. DSM 41528]BDM73858.1 hypothetical protein HEK616_73450 [Streptomyces nigrescens]